ncbi:hypothetical protein [Candidatus Thiosymbion oneisti]|uniref:hypothetical protein n=1 Tax=Candidatus Thiosymbion oneisti TaxID=589554 RepID=UPI00105C9069|nr:hypothetical protein [Candidatus Thiosymbion oneisti]
MNEEASDELPREAAEEILILYKTVFESKDRPGQLLRLHALTEWYIERILSMFLRKPDIVIKDSRFTYSHKLKIVQAQNGLPDRVLDALRRLTKLRNECAHSMYPVISDENIIDAAQPIKKEFNLTVRDRENDGLEHDAFHTYVWALFSELSLAVVPLETAYDELFGENSSNQKDTHFSLSEATKLKHYQLLN